MTVAPTDDRIASLQHGDELWEQLQAQLEARLTQPVYATSDWTGHDVYAHFARWQQNTIDGLRLLIAGTWTAHEPEDEDTLNARWAADDRSLPTEDVRVRCLRTREELRRLLISLTPQQWERFGKLCSADISGEHYEHHLRGLAGERGAS